MYGPMAGFRWGFVRGRERLVKASAALYNLEFIGALLLVAV
jgi:hypothetical protein